MGKVPLVYSAVGSCSLQKARKIEEFAIAQLTLQKYKKNLNLSHIFELLIEKKL